MPGQDSAAEDGFHDEAWALIPWYVTGTLDDHDAARMAAHLERCPICAAELRAQTRLMRAVRDTDPLAGAAERSWDTLRARLSAEQGARRAAPAPAGASVPRRGRVRSRSGRAVPLAAASALAASVALALGLGALWRGGDAPPAPGQEGFRTLTTPQPAGRMQPGRAVVRVLAAEGVPPGRIAEIAREGGLRVARGPSARRVYTLAPMGDGALAGIAAALDARPEIDFASVRPGE